MCAMLMDVAALCQIYRRHNRCLTEQQHTIIAIRKLVGHWRTEQDTKGIERDEKAPEKKQIRRNSDTGAKEIGEILHGIRFTQVIKIGAEEIKD